VRNIEDPGSVALRRQIEDEWSDPPPRPIDSDQRGFQRLREFDCLSCATLSTGRLTTYPDVFSEIVDLLQALLVFPER
jgi:hypothetical protein